MCTVVTWADNEKAVVVSRNMDWFEQMETKLWVLPAGMEIDGAGVGDPNPLKWTSKYGSVIASVYDIGSVDGLNQKGLGAHALWLTPSVYGDREASRPGLSVSLWAQYYLDNFETVAQAVADYQAHPYQIIAADIAGQPATVHLQVSDATGDVAIFESLAGQIKIHHGEQYTVLTNQPTFDQQLANLKKFQGLGGDAPLPGSTTAEDRFVRASYYREHLTAPADSEMAIAEILSVLRDAAQPFGAASIDQPMIAPTIWRTTCDHTNLRYFYESMFHPYLVWLDLADLDFTPGAPVKELDLTQMTGKIGNQAQSLIDAQLFTFAKASEAAASVPADPAPAEAGLSKA